MTYQRPGGPRTYMSWRGRTIGASLRGNAHRARCPFSCKRVACVYRLPAALRPAVAPATCTAECERPMRSARLDFAVRTRGAGCSSLSRPRRVEFDSVPKNAIRLPSFIDTIKPARLAVGDAPRDARGTGSGGAGERMQAAAPATDGRPTSTASVRADHDAQLTDQYLRRAGTRASQGRGWGMLARVRAPRHSATPAARPGATGPQACMDNQRDIPVCAPPARVSFRSASMYLSADACLRARMRPLADMPLSPGMYLSANTRTLSGRVHPSPRHVIAVFHASAPNGCIEDSLSAHEVCLSLTSTTPRPACKDPLRGSAVPRRGAQHLGVDTPYVPRRGIRVSALHPREVPAGGTPSPSPSSRPRLTRRGPPRKASR